MDARTRERAFDDLFTTKVSGSGLGLAFMSRVAAAHGGTARAEDVEPHGTRIRLVLRSGRGQIGVTKAATASRQTVPRAAVFLTRT